MIPSLFFRQREEKAFISWLFLGPFFMCVSASIAMLFNPVLPLFLLALSLGIFSTIFFDKAGLIVSLSLLFCLSIYIHLSNSHHLWLLALESSMALSFFLTHSSFLEIKRLFILSRNNAKEAMDKVEKLNDLIEEEKNCLHRYKKDTKEEFTNLKHESEKNVDLLFSYRKLTDL